MIQNKITFHKVDAFLISSTYNINYVSGFPNFSPFEREGFVILVKDKKYIITDARYTESVKKDTSNFQIVEISLKNPLEKILENLARMHKIKTIAVEEANLTVKEHKKISKYFKNIVDFNLNKLRSIKDKEEIEKIKNACKIADQAFEHILTNIKTGITEKEIADEIHLFVKRKGANNSFDSIVAFGKNSAIPHHQPTDTKLAKKDIILLDFGVNAQNYCNDMTRTVFLGKATAEQKNAYNAVLEAQKKAIEQCSNPAKTGQSKIKIKASKIDKVARDYITLHGYPTIPHSLGHGIGLEVHEAPRLSPASSEILKPGMVFSIEPGIYIPGKFGIRIEDMVLVTNKGCEVLSGALHK